jgi:hypothetical protein
VTKRTPDRSLEQRRAALKWANDVRSARAELKVRINRDRTLRTLELALRNRTEDLGLEPRTLETMKVVDALIAARGIGKAKINRALNAIGMSPSKTIAGMTDRQRDELLGLLRPALKLTLPPRRAEYGADQGERVAA